MAKLSGAAADDDATMPGASSFEALTSPSALRAALPLTPAAITTVTNARRAIRNILRGADDRLLVVVGPCSLHDLASSIDYAARLRNTSDAFAADLQIVMRAYFDKPRTTLGWKGLINDPNLDGSHRIEKGLRLARGLLCQFADGGLPVACELLDSVTPLYLQDCIAWGAVGARTSESQLHRQMASAATFPIGFKNGTSGDLQGAVDAMVVAKQAHTYISVGDDGRAAICRTPGNADTHVVLRGGRRAGPNYAPEHVREVRTQMREAGLRPAVMVDCSHGNAAGDHRNQIGVCSEVADQIRDGDRGIVGVMIESFLEAGRQPISGNPLVYGQSVTDACVSWDETVSMLVQLAEATRQRRRVQPR